MEKQEKGKEILIGVLLGIIIALCILILLVVTNVIDIRKNNNISNTENHITTDISKTTTLTNGEALSIIKRLYNDDIRYIYNQAVSYCGEREIGEGANLIIDGFNYTKSKSFKSFKEVENHLRTYMTESLLSNSNYNRSVTINGKEITSYIEKNGALYCNGWNKGGNLELVYYIEDETIFEISNISETSIEARIDAVYYDVDKSVKTVKKINVTAIKENSKWLLNSYSELS